MNTLALSVVLALVSLSAAACDKGASGGPPGAGSASAASTTVAPDCESVVEKIASLNPPDMRGDAEKKLWRSMCGDMKPAQRTCVLGAKAMDDMKACMK